MPEQEPITREEKFLNGEVGMTPITREEKILAGEDVETITRREYFLKKYRGGGGDVTVVPLSVTENGTYSEENTAYRPVIVNVPAPPIPDNAYLLNDLSGLPADIASFTDGSSLPMPSLKVGIEPIQSGSGDPSPTNIRPISGWTEANMTRCGKNLATESSGNNKVVGSVRKGCTYTFSVHNTGTIGFNLKKNSNSGYVVASSGSASSDETISVTFTADDNYNLFVNGYGSGGATYGDNASNYQLEIGTTATEYEPYNGQTYNIQFRDGDNPLTVYGGEVDVVNGIVTPAPYYASYNGEALTGEWISDRDKYEVGTTPSIGAQVVNIGASGTPVSILPTAIKSLRGVNNLWANTGDIKDAEYFSKEV